MEHVSLFEAIAYQEHEANWLTDQAKGVLNTIDEKGVDFDARNHMRIHPNGCPNKETCPICSVVLQGQLASDGNFDQDVWSAWQERYQGQ